MPGAPSSRPLWAKAKEPSSATKGWLSAGATVVSWEGRRRWSRKWVERICFSWAWPASSSTSRPGSRYRRTRPPSRQARPQPKLATPRRSSSSPQGSNRAKGCGSGQTATKISHKRADLSGGALAPGASPVGINSLQQRLGQFQVERLGRQFAQAEQGLGALDPADLPDPLEQQLAQVLLVPGPQPHQEVGVAGDDLHLLHLGQVPQLGDGVGLFAPLHSGDPDVDQQSVA